MQGEYKGDFTRDTFDVSRHYLRVLTQQGRVSIDADWNEQTSILLHFLHALGADLLGPHWGSFRPGFAIGPFTTAQAVRGDFRIGAGCYYVDGIRCEADEPSVPIIAASAPHTVTLPTLTVDGRAILKNSYVEIYDTATPAAVAATMARVVNVDRTSNHLSLDITLTPAMTSATTLRLRRAMTYLTQPDYPAPPLRPQGAAGTLERFVYLDVWERHVTCLDDDAIREVALGTADTASRARIVWQVKVAELNLTPAAALQDHDEFLTALEQYLYQGAPPGMLRARATVAATSSDPCSISPDARYRGVENQLYRVEVHTGGPVGTATFKWSRENGSVVYPVVAGGGTNVLTLEHIGRDARSELKVGDWVEAQDDASIPLAAPPRLLMVEAIDRTDSRVTLSDPALIGNVPGRHGILIRWESNPQLGRGPDNAPEIVEAPATGAWLPLEDGIEIQFPEPAAGRPPHYYRPGDYWLIPARVATGDVEWPVELDEHGQRRLVGGASIPIAREPHGTQHHYAPLGVIRITSNGTVTRTGDSRRLFVKTWP